VNASQLEALAVDMGACSSNFKKPKVPTSGDQSNGDHPVSTSKPDMSGKVDRTFDGKPQRMD